MRRIMLTTTLATVGLLAACGEDPDLLMEGEAESAPLAEIAQAVQGRGYCAGAGNPPAVYEPVRTHRRLPSKWCDNARVVGWNDAVLYRGTNWAVCQEIWPNGWQVYTLGDSGSGLDQGWDFFRATSFSGGEGGGPIPGLINCNAYWPD